MAGSLVHQLHVRPRAHKQPRQPRQETPPWQAVALMFVLVAFLAALLMAACFAGAELAAGHGFI